MMECVSCSGDNDESFFFFFLNVTHFLHFRLFLLLFFEIYCEVIVTAKHFKSIKMLIIF